VREQVKLVLCTELHVKLVNFLMVVEFEITSYMCGFHMYHWSPIIAGEQLECKCESTRDHL